MTREKALEIPGVNILSVDISSVEFGELEFVHSQALDEAYPNKPVAIALHPKGITKMLDRKKALEIVCKSADLIEKTLSDNDVE